MLKKISLECFLIILGSIYPFINFIDKNVQQLNEYDYLYLFSYLLIFISLILLFYLILRKIFYKKLKNLSLLISYSIIYFFSYGLIHELIKNINYFSNDRISAFFTWLIIFFIIIFILKRIISNKIFYTFSFFFLFFLNFFLSTSFFYNFFLYHKKQTIDEEINRAKILENINQNIRISPNVYYLLLDTYPRSDVLKEFYNINNYLFLEKLTKKGYLISNNSKSNAIGTETSMSTVFSMDLKYAKKTILNKENIYKDLWLKGNTTVHSIFKKIGYKNFISFDNTIQGAACLKSNKKNNKIDKCIGPKIRFTEVENNFLKSTPIIDILGKFFPSFFAYEFLYLDFINESLDDLVLSNKSFFYYIHLIMPHPPPKFNENCEKKIDVFKINVKDKFFDDGAKKGMRDDIKCINQGILEFVDKINLIDPDSIVIIQSDNGIPTLPFPKSHFNINFWKLPKSCKNLFYDQITNVNTFRVVFNCIGAGKWNLVDDKLIEIK